MADPDPWRGQLRAALVLRNRARRLEALRTLARRVSPEELPAISVDLFGKALLSDGDATLGVDVLRRPCAGSREMSG